ncbi:hypothetical protein EPR50_G00092580 [Perca flavescens]|uniref:Mitochondrial inner membrane protease subunit 2 n=1 Tax=Perca flavescens TaxID=8167 RepID=A0A484D3P7_PERFV|nr:hypothetical protein EPR50_G00092580 [Perca flavescens]
MNLWSDSDTISSQPDWLSSPRNSVPIVFCDERQSFQPSLAFKNLRQTKQIHPHPPKPCFLIPLSCQNRRLSRHGAQGLPQSPKNPQQKIIKRVIGLEGDFIRTLGYKNRYVRVPDGHFWIEGDHHGHSLDSNSFGPVAVGLLHGRASHIIWPPNRWQRIKASLPANRGPLDTEEEEG